MTVTLRSRLSEFIAGVDFSALPPEVVHQTKKCLLDFLGVALAGGNTGLVPAMSHVIFQMDGRPDTTVIGEPGMVSVANAALLNGVKGHALDMDDGHRFASAHPAVVIFPAALALAEQQDLGGSDLIESVVAGYETLIYLAKGVNPSHLRRGFHTTATLGSFGAAAACSKILRLEKGRIENALSIAGLSGGGLLEVLSSGQMMKPFQTGRASQSGLIAALLAQRDARGPQLIFEGRNGFLRAYTDVGVQTDRLEEPGRTFEIMNVYFKMHAACRHVHPALDAVFEIMRHERIDPSAIENVSVETYSVARDLTAGNRESDSYLAAKFNLPVSVALGILYGRAGSEQYSPGCLDNPAVNTLAKKVQVKIDAIKEEAYPDKRGARVRIRHAGGESSCDMELPWGEPERPFSDEVLLEKFMRNAEMALSIEQVDVIQKLVFSLEKTSVKNLMASLRPRDE